MVVTADGGVEERYVGSKLLPWTAQPWHTLQESVLTTQRSILRAWNAGRDAETSGIDNLKTFALVEAANKAAETGCRTEPVPVPF